jgi:hypothetical protein
VTVANGDKIEIIESGSIDLFSEKITKYFVCSRCPTNLLSINKITQELNCEIIFTTKKVIFQE